MAKPPPKGKQLPNALANAQGGIRNGIRANFNIIVTAVSLAVGGVTGYATLRSSVGELQKNRVTTAQYIQVKTELAEIRRVMNDTKVVAMDAQIKDINREIDTLYLKAEDALRRVANLRAEVYELRGQCRDHCRDAGTSP